MSKSTLIMCQNQLELCAISMASLAINDSHWSIQHFYLGTTQNVGTCLDPSSLCKGSGSETNHMLCFNMTYTRQFLPEI